MGVVVEHIVGKALPGAVGHTGHRHFVEPVFALHPAGIPQHGVDVELAGLVLRQIQRFGGISGLLGGAPLGQFLAQGLVFRHEGIQVHLRRRGHRPGGLLGEQGRVKAAGGVVGAVTAGHKVQEIPQVFQAEGGLLGGDGLAVGVVGGVAGLAYVVQPPPQVLVHNVAEFLGVQQADQPIVIGFDQPRIHRVHPFYGKLHRPATVHRAGRRVNGIDFFRRHRRPGKGGKLWLRKEKIEVGHGGSHP